jgi:hypothetical protein
MRDIWTLTTETNPGANVSGFLLLRGHSGLADVPTPKLKRRGDRLKAIKGLYLQRPAGGPDAKINRRYRT